MEHADVEVLLGRQMPHTGEERLPERPIIGPFGKDFVDGRVVDGRLALGIVRYGQALPLHPCVEDPQDEVKDPVIAQFALWPPLGHREVRQDKCGELRFGELDRDRRRCRCAAVMLITQGPLVKNMDVRWGITLRHILQEVRSICKTRNQLLPIRCRQCSRRLVGVPSKSFSWIG